MNPLISRVKRFFAEDLTLSRVLKNTGYLFSSNTLSLVLSFIQSIFAARLLGIAAFGLVGIVTSFVSNVNRLFSFRMGEFIIRYLGKELTEENTEKAGAVVKVAMLAEAITSLIAFGFLLLMAPLGAKFIAKDMQALPMIQLFGISILTSAVYESSLGVLQITNHFRTQAAINLLQSLLTAAIIAAAFFLNGSIYTVLAAYLVGKIILGISPAILAQYHLRRHLHPQWWKASMKQLPPFKEMIRYTVSTNLSGTIKMVVSESEPLWVGFFLDKSAVGLYKLALSIINPLMMPITPFITTSFPEMTRSVVSRSWKQLRRLLRRMTIISASWTFFIALVMAFFGRWLIELIYTQEFVPAYPATMILLAGFGISNIFFWNRSLLLSFGKANIPLYVLFAAAVLKVGLSFWIVPAYGINGAACLLTGNFILTVAVMVIIGLILIRRNEQHGVQES